MRSSNKEELVLVGKITGAHGIKGEVKMLPYGGMDDFAFKTIFTSLKGVKTERAVTRVRVHKGVFILELENLSDRTEAESFTGQEVFVRKAELPELEEDEFYYFDLVGMEVNTDDGRKLGSVEGIIETGSNDVLQVTGPFGEVLVPVIEGSQIKVDEEKRQITVHLLEGLLPGEGE